jgi:hypothetical protein
MEKEKHMELVLIYNLYSGLLSSFGELEYSMSDKPKLLEYGSLIY